MVHSYKRSYDGNKNKGLYWKWILVFCVLVLVIFFGYRWFSSGDKAAQVDQKVVKAGEGVVKNPVSQPKPEPKLIPKPGSEQKPIAEILRPAVAKAEVVRDSSVPVNNSDGLANPKVEELISNAISVMESNPSQIIEARYMLNDVLPMQMSEAQRQIIKSKLSDLSKVWLFSKQIFPKDNLCSGYKVQSGDLFANIGKSHKVPYAILMEINEIKNPMSLQAGQILKVINGPFHAKVYKSKLLMDLYLQNTYVRSFNIGIGKPGRETPTGLWVVQPGKKLEKPTWTDPDTGKRYESEDPNYPLGSFYIGLEGLSGDALGKTGIAIHGVKEAEDVGAYSRGCVRLYNGDVKLVYSLFSEGLSQVEIRD